MVKSKKMDHDGDKNEIENKADGAGAETHAHAHPRAETGDESDAADDVTFESVNSEEAGRDSVEVLKKLKEKLKRCEGEKQELLSGWQRAQADFVNYRKRDALERQEFAKYAAEPVILDVIAVLDSFDEAFGNKEALQKVDKAWKDGLERIYGQLRKALEGHGVKSDDPTGKPFEPMSHQAVQMVAVEKPEEDGMIVGVVQKGYALEGKIIRPAKVRVGEMKSK
jgi:molecular chaperone GrpE